MTYTKDQILTTAVTDPGLAHYYISTLDVETLREYVFELALCVPLPMSDPLDVELAMEQAIRRAAGLLRTTRDAVLSPTRTREATEARQVACYVGRLLRFPYTAIGDQVGRDHTTVLHAVSRVGESPRLRRIASGIAVELGWDRSVEVAS